MTRWAIYARYSSEHQNERSIEDQVRLCREHVARLGGEIADVYADYALSGAHLASRPNAVRLLADAEDGKIDGVMAEALDRLSRDLEDTAAVYKRLTFAGVKLVTASEGEISELHVGLKGTMNALFLKDLAAKIRRGQTGTVAKGRSAGGLSYGYAVKREIDGRGELVRGLREVDQQQAEIVKRIFREYAAGDSPRAIAARLNRDGVPSPTGGEWMASTINGNRARGVGILWQEAYVGRLVYNKVRMVKDPKTGKRISRPNPTEQWQVVDAPELRIVSDDVWTAVQAIKAGYANLSVNRRRRPRHPLSGLIRCGKCGGSFTIKNNDQLACATHREKGTCANGHTIRIPELEQRIFDALRRQLANPDVMAAYVAEYHAEMKRLDSQRKAAAAKAESRVAATRKRIRNLVDAIAEGFGTPEVKAELRRLEAEKAGLEAELQLAGEADNVIDLHPSALAAFRAMLGDLQDAISKDDQGRAEATTLLQAMIARIEVHPGQKRGQTELRLQWRILETLNLAKAVGQGEVRSIPRSAVMVVAEEGLEPPTRGL